MLLRPFALAAAGLAAATHAFLLPPDVSQSDVEIVDSLPDIGALSVPQQISLNVSCPGCLHRASHLELAFSIDHTPQDGDRLVVNGFPLYPKANPFISSLKAPLLPDGKRPAVNELRKHHRFAKWTPRELGYQLSVRQQAANQEDGLALDSIDLQIIEVGNVFVDGIPNVHIKLVKDIATGALAIGGIETTESETAVDAPAPKPEECTTFVCQWLTSMKENMAKMKTKCHGKMRGGAHGVRPPHRGGHHHHQGRPHKTGGRHHSWGKLLKEIGQHVLLPIAVGIIAGISVSLIGMMVGTLIVSVWRVLFRRPSHRRRKSDPSSKASKTEVAAGEAEEKSGLMEHQEAPPSYDEEAAPAYEDEPTLKTSA